MIGCVERTLRNFSGGAITSDGGILLLRSIDQRLKLTEQVAAQITDPRDPGKTQHQVADLLRQRVYGLACGYEDLNDHDTLRNDIALQTAVEKDQRVGRVRRKLPQCLSCQLRLGAP